MNANRRRLNNALGIREPIFGINMRVETSEKIIGSVFYIHNYLRLSLPAGRQVCVSAVSYLIFDI